MKLNRRQGAATFATAAALGLVLTSCSSEGEAAGSDADENGAATSELTIGLINSANNEWGSCMQGGVESAAEAADITLHTANSDADAAQEVSNMEDMISRDVDAILMNTVSVDSLESSIQRAQAADIPLYLIAVMPQDGLDDILGATIVDLPGVGAQAGEWFAQDADGQEATVAVVAGAPGAASDMTISGFEEALPDNVTVVGNQPGMYNRSEAMAVAENFIEANPDLDYAFVLNEDMAFGVSNAFSAAGRDDVKIVTQNGTEPGLEAIENGEFSATVADSAMHLGETALEAAVAQLENPDGEKVTRMETLLLTDDNLDEAIPFCG